MIYKTENIEVAQLYNGVDGSCKTMKFTIFSLSLLLQYH